MDFSLSRPCPECPFTDVPTAVRGPCAGRIMELTEGMLSSQGIVFSCHKTVDYSEGESPTPPREQHCAGALIFALKQDTMTQMMRIAERLGWEPERLLAGQGVVDSVYDSTHDMLDGHRARAGVKG